VVGHVDQEVLADRLTDVERELGRDVNVVTYARAEQHRLREQGDPFVVGSMRYVCAPTIRGAKHAKGIPSSDLL
jgi:hypothetical protein